jgi:hypothetical protein
MRRRKCRVASGGWRARTPDARRRTPDAYAGLTLVEVLMSLMVTGIGILGVISLLPLAFVRAVQATNLTNGTILRFDAESFIDVSPRLLLRWQANTAYSNTTPNYLNSEGVPASLGDLIINPNYSTIGFQCTTAGTSGLTPPPSTGPSPPAWNTTVGGTTNDGTCVWTTVQVAQNVAAGVPIAFPPPRFVVDPMGWWAENGTNIQTTLGNNGGGAAYANAIPRFSGQVPNTVTATMQAYLPDSWVEQARGAVTAFTANTATMSNVDLSSVPASTLTTLAAANPPYVTARVVLIDATGKTSQTRILTNVASPTVTWSASDPLTGTFTPVAARVETQDVRYTWLLTVMPSPAGGSSNVWVTVFFNRTLASIDEQAYSATGADGVQTPFTVTYSGTKPFVKKGGFMFDCVFGRWYRIVNVVDLNATQFNVFVDQTRPATDLVASNQLEIGQTFGAVFMRGIVDVFPLPLK